MRDTDCTRRAQRTVPVVVLAALAGCSSSAPLEPDTTSPAAAYVRTSDWGVGDGALLEGTLQLANDCLVVVNDGGTRVVPVFPTDLTWDSATDSLVGLGHSFTVGDQVALGGGYHGSSSVAEHVPPGCEGTEYFLVHSTP